MTTWDPATAGSHIVLSNGNLTATGSAGGVNNSVRGTTSQNTGKWYFEILIGGSTFNEQIGVATSALVGSSGLGGGSDNGSARPTDGSTAVASSFSLVNATGVTWAAGDTMTFAVDFDAGKIWISKNSTWCASGNPTSGTNPWATFTPNIRLFPAFSTASSTTDAATLHTSVSTIVYSPPTGFTLWDPPPPVATGPFGFATMNAVPLLHPKILYCHPHRYSEAILSPTTRSRSSQSCAS